MPYRNVMKTGAKLGLSLSRVLCHPCWAYTHGTVKAVSEKRVWTSLNCHFAKDRVIYGGKVWFLAVNLVSRSQCLQLLQFRDSIICFMIPYIHFPHFKITQQPKSHTYVIIYARKWPPVMLTVLLGRCGVNFTGPIPYVSIRRSLKLINAFILNYVMRVSKPAMSNLVGSWL